LRETDGGNTETAPAGLPHPPSGAAHPCLVRNPAAPPRTKK